MDYHPLLKHKRNRLNGLALLLGKLYAYLPLDLRAAMLRGRKHTKEAGQPKGYGVGNRTLPVTVSMLLWQGSSTEIS